MWIESNVVQVLFRFENIFLTLTIIDNCILKKYIWIGSYIIFYIKMPQSLKTCVCKCIRGLFEIISFRSVDKFYFLTVYLNERFSVIKASTDNKTSESDRINFMDFLWNSFHVIKWVYSILLEIMYNFFW